MEHRDTLTGWEAGPRKTPRGSGLWGRHSQGSPGREAELQKGPVQDKEHISIAGNQGSDSRETGQLGTRVTQIVVRGTAGPRELI